MSKRHVTAAGGGGTRLSIITFSDLLFSAASSEISKEVRHMDHKQASGHLKVPHWHAPPLILLQIFQRPAVQCSKLLRKGPHGNRRSHGDGQMQLSEGCSPHLDVALWPDYADVIAPLKGIRRRVISLPDNQPAIHLHFSTAAAKLRR